MSKTTPTTMAARRAVVRLRRKETAWGSILSAVAVVLVGREVRRWKLKLKQQQQLGTTMACISERARR